MLGLHHVVLHLGAAHGDYLEGFQCASCCHNGIGGRNGRNDVLYHTLSELICDALQIEQHAIVLLLAIRKLL